MKLLTFKLKGNNAFLILLSIVMQHCFLVKIKAQSYGPVVCMSDNMLNWQTIFLLTKTLLIPSYASLSLCRKTTLAVPKALKIYKGMKIITKA